MHIRWSAYPSNGSRLVRDESDFLPKWEQEHHDREQRKVLSLRDVIS